MSTEEQPAPPLEPEIRIPVVIRQDVGPTSCRHGRWSWIWENGVMTDRAQCWACGEIKTPSTAKQDKSQ